jgi:hypothetical protein
VKKLALVAGGAVLGLVALALLLDAVAAIVQPALDPDREAVLHTFDADGTRHDTRLALGEDVDGTLWIQSGHHFRGWYHRLLENPRVELTRGGVTRPYTAVAIDTPESEAKVRELFTELAGGPVRFAVIRTLLLFADIKPVRLDPR